MVEPTSGDADRIEVRAESAGPLTLRLRPRGRSVGDIPPSAPTGRTAKRLSNGQRDRPTVELVPEGA